MFIFIYISIDFYLNNLLFLFVYFFEHFFIKVLWIYIDSTGNPYLQRLVKYIYYIIFLFLNNILLILLIYSYLYAGFFFIIINILYWNKYMVVKWSKRCLFLFLLLYLLSWFSFLFFFNWFLFYKLYYYYKRELPKLNIQTVNELISVFLLLFNCFILTEILIPYIHKCFLLKNDYGVSQWNQPDFNQVYSNSTSIFSSCFFFFLFSILYLAYLNCLFLQNLINFDLISYFLCQYLDVYDDVTSAYIPHRYLLWYYFIKPFVQNMMYKVFFFIQSNKWVYKFLYKIFF